MMVLFQLLVALVTVEVCIAQGLEVAVVIPVALPEKMFTVHLTETTSRVRTSISVPVG